MGGKPSPGTKKDKRLKDNKTSSAKPPKFGGSHWSSQNKKTGKK